MSRVFLNLLIFFKIFTILGKKLKYEIYIVLKHVAIFFDNILQFFIVW